MGCGVLDTTVRHVPGTAILNADPNATARNEYGDVDISTLKHASGKHSDLVLVPQPSSTDPNDPLLWPAWKKIVFYAVLLYGTTLAGAGGPLVAADQVHLAEVFGTSLTSLARVLSPYYALVLGCATLMLQVGSIKLGKRPIYLATSLMLFGASLWASYATSLASFAGARVLMGFGVAPLEFLVASSLNDIYYVHERGIPVALWNLALVDGINLTPPITGQILGNKDLGFRWTFRLFAIAVALLFVLQLFFMPETTFDRERINGSRELNNNGSSNDTTDDGANNFEDDGKKERIDPVVTLENQADTGITTIRKKTYLEELAPISGIRKTRANVLTLLARPFLLLFTPIVFFAGATYGLGITLLVIDAVSISMIFASPPYNFSTKGVGNTYFGPFICSGIAMVLAGPLSNFCARALSKRNKGIYEPEFKLPPMVLYAFFGILGFVGYGWSLDADNTWIVPVIFFGISNAGVVFASTASIEYLIDSHRHTADAALGAVIFWKNIWTFGLTWDLVAQVEKYGPRNVFGIIGVVIAVTCIATIPMYIFGKRTRALIHRYIAFEENN